MPINDTDIANKALIFLGARPLGSINNASSDVGLAVKTLYPLERDSMLQRWPWNFARKQVLLAQLQCAPPNLDLIPQPDNASASIAFTAAYALPPDFIRMVRFAPRRAKWRIVGQAIYTDAVAVPVTANINGMQPLGADGADNQPSLTVVNGGVGAVGFEYIWKVIDANIFSPLFIDTLASKLAYELAFSITGLSDVQDRAKNAWSGPDGKGGKQADAEAAHAAEQWPDQLYDTSVADARWKGSAGEGGSWGWT